MPKDRRQSLTSANLKKVNHSPNNFQLIKLRPIPSFVSSVHHTLLINYYGFETIQTDMSLGSLQCFVFSECVFLITFIGIGSVVMQGYMFTNRENFGQHGNTTFFQFALLCFFYFFFICIIFFNHKYITKQNKYCFFNEVISFLTPAMLSSYFSQTTRSQKWQNMKDKQAVILGCPNSKFSCPNPFFV